MHISSYPGLALIFGSIPEFSSFKRFRVANSHNLLLLQAEIVNTYADFLQLTDSADLNRQADQPSLAEWAEKLRNFTPGDTGPWALALKLRSLLKEYNEAILLYREICRLPSANPQDTAQLRHWFGVDPPGGGADFLRGVERDIWRNDADLLSVTRASDAAGASLLRAQNAVVSSVYKFFKGEEKDQVMSLSEPTFPFPAIDVKLRGFPISKVSAIIDGVSTALAALVPTLSIFALYFTQSAVIRLGIIIVLTIVFGFVLAEIGRARRAEIFAATAAFSAVLVVFVGGYQGS